MEGGSSGRRLKQSKITAFCLSGGNGGARKRRNAAEVFEPHEAPPKRPAGATQEPPADELSALLEGFPLEDLENEPLLSPRKKESPKKAVLGERFLGNECGGGEAGLGFGSAVRCRVVRAGLGSGRWFEQVVVLRACKGGGEGVCRLREAWAGLPLSAGEVVSVEAALREGSWVVDNGGGFVIVQPDVLVPSTALARATFCMRQGVLGHFFRDLPSEDGGRMVVGRVVHELFQEALRTGARSEEQLGSIVAELMQSRDNLHEIFLSSRNVADIEREVKDFVPSLRSFFDVYVDKRVEATGKNFGGTIEGVLDIEELVKSPALGLQGRVDATVRVRSRTGERTAPLELKTGRASFSNEHRSQLTLYVLLMSELGRKVESGLLLYLREGVMEEIVPGRDEIRNLLLLRNYFVGFCKSLGRCILPEPIRNVKCCAKCSCLRVCTAYLSGGEREGVAEGHPIRSLEPGGVKASHVAYFVRWSEMLWVEFAEGEGGAGEGGAAGEVGEVRLGSEAEAGGGQFRYELGRAVGEWSEGERSALRAGGLVEVVGRGAGGGCVGPVVGQVVAVGERGVTVLADRRLTDPSATYRLVPVKTKFLSAYLSTLGWFLRDEFEGLRELIVDKRTPRFDKDLDKADFREKCLGSLVRLNKEQQKAVLRSLLCQDYLLVKGPPGTGKTETIVTLIRILLALGRSVLVAGHTNSSVDNILLRLGDVEYLRLGSLRSIHEDVRERAYSRLKGGCASAEDIGRLFERKLIASTCFGVEASLVGRLKADVCILDESSQILQVEALRPLLCCRKFVLVGDEDQLPPVVRSPKAKALGMAESLFACLANDSATVHLRLQYRMNSVINSLANAIAYGGLLQCACAEVANATMKVADAEEYGRAEPWLAEVLSDELGRAVVFADTSECFRVRREYATEPRRSAVEANIVVRVVGSLVRLGLGRGSVGVISPFSDQIALLKRRLAEGGLEKVEVSTVDQYQGRDKEVIVLSCAKENRSGGDASEQELLSDGRRLTVAVTRAKHKLILVGDGETLAKYDPFKKLLASLEESQILRLSDGEKGFCWENFIK